MTSETIHLLIRAEDGMGFYATSPQAPGMAFGMPTLRELRAEIDEVLHLHFGHPGPFRIVEHHEEHFDVGGRELVTRVADDEHAAERAVVLKRLRVALQVPQQVESLLAKPTNKVGEVVYVCAVSSDTVGWIAAQLDPQAPDALVLTAAVGDNLLIALPFAHGADLYEGSSVIATSDEKDKTVAEIIRDTAIVSPASTERPVILVPC